MRTILPSPRKPEPAEAAILEWLSGEECRALDEAGLIAGLGRRLRNAGLPIDRLVSLRWTLHPGILGGTAAWSPNRPVEICDRDHGIEPAAAFAGSRLHEAMAEGRTVTMRGDDPALAAIDAFCGRDLIELVIVPLAAAGAFRAISFATARKGGFAAVERRALDRITPALASRLGTAGRPAARRRGARADA
jgi:adenylate cyclase